MLGIVHGGHMVEFMLLEHELRGPGWVVTWKAANGDNKISGAVIDTASVAVQVRGTGSGCKATTAGPQRPSL